MHLITELLSDTGDTHTECISYILSHYDNSWFPHSRHNHHNQSSLPYYYCNHSARSYSLNILINTFSVCSGVPPTSITFPVGLAQVLWTFQQHIFNVS